MQPSIWGGAHGLVVDGLGDVVAVKHVRVGLNEQVGHEVHDVAAREVGAGVLVVGLGEALDEVLEDVAHVHGADLVGRHVRLRLAEVADHLVEQGASGSQRRSAWSENFMRARMSCTLSEKPLR